MKTWFIITAARLSCVACAMFWASGAAWGQAVTFSDLQGVVVQSSTMLAQVIKREGRNIDMRLQIDMNITIGPGDELYVVNNTTGYGPRGVRKGPPLTANFALDQSREMRSRGGGHGIWLFAEATLTYLRTYQGGASRHTYSIDRNADGLTCTANITYAREKGVNGIVLNSAVDGVATVILSARQISSNCQLAKAN